MKCSFAEVQYFHRNYKPNPITKRIDFIGFDSESDINGFPFMFTFSDGMVCNLDNLLDTLFSRQYRGVKFVCFNLRYDEGSILHLLSKEALDELRIKGKTIYNGYSYKSIPKKELVIGKGHKSVAFYDIAQFFATSLDKAAAEFLGKSKKEIDVSLFEGDFILDNWDKIAEYSIYDALLTKELADYFIDLLIRDLKIYPQKLYSTGYLAGIHFSRTCDIVDINRYYKNHIKLVEYGYNSYAGGKFETYKRGYGYFYQYDINSAYPYEIANLKNIRLAKLIHSARYQPEADYGFIKCRVYLHSDYSPLAIKNNNINYFPLGSFDKIITKGEYDFLIGQGNSIDIIDAYWLKCPDDYPFRDEVLRLYDLKAKYKGNDKIRYLLVKILLNSFYGKFIQITEKYKKDIKVFEAGYLFNPFYASIITANTRVKVCKICSQYPDNVIAVHTDSVITDLDLEQNGLKCSTDLGEWAKETEGQGVVVGSGVYQIGDKVHYRGYKSINSLLDLILANKGKVNIPVDQQLVLSWRLVAFRNLDDNMINRFIKGKEASKKLNLHFDNKRDWAGGWDWSGGLVGSSPYITVSR